MKVHSPKICKTLQAAACQWVGLWWTPTQHLWTVCALCGRIQASSALLHEGHILLQHCLNCSASSHTLQSVCSRPVSSSENKNLGMRLLQNTSNRILANCMLHVLHSRGWLSCITSTPTTGKERRKHIDTTASHQDLVTSPDLIWCIYHFQYNTHNTESDTRWDRDQDLDQTSMQVSDKVVVSTKHTLCSHFCGKHCILSLHTIAMISVGTCFTAHYCVMLTIP